MKNDRLMKQIRFIIEIDRLKKVFRRNIVIGTIRNENDAEHSWHLTIMAMLLSEYSADRNIDILKVIRMVTVHDLVEIDAGDTFCYDDKANEDKAEREEKAANRLFAILPEDQSEEIFSLWREFEEGETPEAKFASCLDRLQPLLLNYSTEGYTWQSPEVTSEKVLNRNRFLEKNAPELWEYAKEIIEDSINKGFLRR
ncbi:putative hydrolase of HD superfamily [Ruminiclostridium sufflavum DSM 19573]|uniref:Putative hydrolase of HD superfamily n=1 Tax=Ruminiclostridium sufflavum DSM 19573 TaxID=1121337 RepID=A0A318XM64_9FIRM|nr:HD domain-containing protein [Ruminiclostridium sufflavum]PYG87032.1 putative hydrolase of HD superfamily [Ruminiclostridium sufflavum DSM 19573]